LYTRCTFSLAPGANIIDKKEVYQMSTLKFKRFVFCSVVVAIAFVLSGCRSAPVVSLAQGTPGETVESFYRWYIDYPGNVLVDGAYRSSEYLTEELVQQVDEIIASFDKGGYDPFLCAQDVPGNLAFDQAVVSGEDASVVVHEIWNPGTPYETRTEVTVALQMVDGKWKIADIICPASQVAATPEQVVESFYNWYLSYTQDTGNVLADRAYQSSEHLTEGFVKKVDKLLASFDKGGYDQYGSVKTLEVFGRASRWQNQFEITLKAIGWSTFETSRVWPVLN
jgi:hypothetical protein